MFFKKAGLSVDKTPMDAKKNSKKAPSEEPLVVSDPTAFKDANSALASQGIASVNMTSGSGEKRVWTPQMFEKILKELVGDNENKKRRARELFSNLDKLDYENMDLHFDNISTFLSMGQNEPEKTIRNGYFYSREGAEAFKLLSGMFSPLSKSGSTAPLSAILPQYTPQAVLTLKKRNLLNADELTSCAPRLNKLANMDDKEYANFMQRAQDSIQQSGRSYNELKEELKNELNALFGVECNSFYFSDKHINIESVVPQLEFVNILKTLPQKFDQFEVGFILSHIDINNIESHKRILSLFEKQLSLKNMPFEIFSNLNKKTEPIIERLLQEGISPSLVAQYSYTEGFSEGLVSYEKMLEIINNDPYMIAIQKIENSSADLAPKNVKISELNPRKIETSALALVHLTNYEPEEGMLLSTRDKIGGSRNSVHFALNHPPASHSEGDWEGSKCAVIMPYDSTVELNGKKKFIEGMPSDLYTNGSVKIPEGAVVIKHNPDLQEGEVKISDHPNIEGAKLIESSILPHKLTPNVLKSMGYSYMNSTNPVGMFYYGNNDGKNIEDTLENYSAWKSFCKSEGIIPSLHSGSAGGVAEAVVEKIGELFLAGSKTWLIRRGDEGIVDLKGELLDCLETIKPWQENGEYVSYNIDEMINIIDTSDTPKDAILAIEEKFGFHHSSETCDGVGGRIPMKRFIEWHEMYENPEVMAQVVERKLTKNTW